MWAVASAIRSTSLVIDAKYRSPASVKLICRPIFVISDVPSCTSKSWICWLTADGVHTEVGGSLRDAPCLCSGVKYANGPDGKLHRRFPSQRVKRPDS